MICAITGGTGSFGSALAKHLLANTPHSVRVIDRSDQKMAVMMRETPPSIRTTYILADVRDRMRLNEVLRGADVVYHAAALKQVPFGERHPEEYAQTNIGGTENVIQASIFNNVPKVLFISSDKAVEALNAYGKTKAMAESLVIAANQRSAITRFACARGGNVWASRGSVLEQWVAYSAFDVYSPGSTRFHLIMNDWLEFCVRAVREMHGGEIFVPICKAWNLLDLARAFVRAFPSKSFSVSAPRLGDKRDEFLVSANEMDRMVFLPDWAYVVEPGYSIRGVWNYIPHHSVPAPIGSNARCGISSADAPLLSVDELTMLIEQWRDKDENRRV